LAERALVGAAVAQQVAHAATVANSTDAEEVVARVGLERSPGYLYFLDKNGDMPDLAWPSPNRRDPVL
jgi:hypothetical protein